jgi:hypothetical protein
LPRCARYDSVDGGHREEQGDKAIPGEARGSRFFPWKREFFADPLAELRFVGKK